MMQRLLRRGAVLLVMVSALLGTALTACQSRAATGAIPSNPVVELPRPTPAPVWLPYDFPASAEAGWERPGLRPGDDAPHQNLTEWWYYTGHLWVADGRRYGFEFVIFQSVRGDNPVGYLSHFAITDLARERFAYGSRATPKATVPDLLDLDVEGWTIQGGGGQDRIRAAMDGYAIDLRTIPRKPTALHGGGYINFGPAGDSYYYSRTRLDVRGTLRDGDELLEVTGQAWFDHQWGDYVVAAVGGWDWYAFQLDDGTDLMLYSLRDLDGRPGEVFGSWVDAAGRTYDIVPPLGNVRATSSWTSPHTGATYPSGWDIALRAPDAGLRDLRLEVTPVLRDQELAFQRMPYWEGAVEVQGSAGGQPVTGLGYVELTVYQP